MKNAFGKYFVHKISKKSIELTMKKSNNPSKTEKKEHLADLFCLPHDVVCGASNVTVVGSMRVFIENYKGILEYNNQEILLQGKHKKIKIIGNCLKIRTYNEEEMVIDGVIEGILFMD